MRVANRAGRLVLVTGQQDDTLTALDVERASGGLFGSDVDGAYARWDELREWAAGATDPGEPVDVTELGSPVTRPGQLFAIGLNYAAHAAESRFDVPDNPPVFTKFASAITGPYGELVHPGGDMDWEVELVAVIGRAGHRVDEVAGWDHVAGLTVGQDLSERRLQLSGSPPQFSLGKSYPGFAPMGPVLVTPDELPDRDDLELGCWVDDEQVQHGRTAQMIFSVPQLVARLSAVTPLSPGDVIFTGTPAGVGLGRTPPRYLAVGERLRTSIAGIGEMRHVVVAGPVAGATGA